MVKINLPFLSDFTDFDLFLTGKYAFAYLFNHQTHTLYYSRNGIGMSDSLCRMSDSLCRMSDNLHRMSDSSHRMSDSSRRMSDSDFEGNYLNFVESNIQNKISNNNNLLIN